MRAVKNRFGAVERAGRVRDDRRGPAAGAESVAAVPGRAARRTCRARRCCARSRARGRSSSKCRRSSARRRSAIARRTANGLDHNRLVAAARGARQARRPEPRDRRRVRQRRGRDERRRAGRGPRGARGGRVEPAQPCRFRRTSSSSARSAWPARCGRRRRRRCACAKPRSSASRGASCPTATLAPEDAPAGPRDRRRAHGRRGARRPVVSRSFDVAMTGFLRWRGPCSSASWSTRPPSSGPIDGHPLLERRCSVSASRCSSWPPKRGCATPRSRACSAACSDSASASGIAQTIGSALFWADTSNTKVQFLHGLIIVVLPYLGLMLGARKGEWLEPAKFVSLFRDARPQKRYKILDTSVIIDGRVADIVETGLPRRHAGRAAVRAEGAAVRRRLVRSAEAQPRPARPRHPAAHPEDGRRRSRHLGHRLSAGQGSRPEADRAGALAARQDRDERLQPEQSRAAARRRGAEHQRAGQRR